MSDAPERIWAFYAPHIAEDEGGATIVAYETVQHGAAEYVRANMQPTVSPELLATTHDVAALVEALEFYADWDNWIQDWRGVSLVDQDEGKTARASLAEIKSGVATTPYGLEGENHE